MTKKRICIISILILLTISALLTSTTNYMQYQRIFIDGINFYDTPNAWDVTMDYSSDFADLYGMGMQNESTIYLNQTNMIATVYDENDNQIYSTVDDNNVYETYRVNEEFFSVSDDNGNDMYCRIEYECINPVSEQDDYYPLYKQFTFLYSIRYAVVVLNIACIIGALALSVILIWKKKMFGDSNLPCDLIILGSLVLLFCMDIVYHNFYSVFASEILIIAFITYWLIVFFVVGCVVGELKRHTFIQNLYVMKLNMVFRIVILGIVIAVLQFIISRCLFKEYAAAGWAQAVLILAEVALLATYIFNNNRRLQQMIEEKVKSERMKTELITNVSHDLKTPVTSIVNYMDLIMKEEINNDKASEYLEVINRQTIRLKKLVCDVVDASKAASGNTPINMTYISVKEMLNQSIGEYTDKFSDKKLDLQLTNESDCMVSADGDALWRVFDNILCNISKYSLEGTRVYITVKENDNQCITEFKNISKERLNISSEELKERFVRGDESRNTDGSGLGLAIANSLMELMKGNLSIMIDGDLFKATIVLNKANLNE